MPLLVGRRVGLVGMRGNCDGPFSRFTGRASGFRHRFGSRTMPPAAEPRTSLNGMRRSMVHPRLHHRQLAHPNAVVARHNIKIRQPRCFCGPVWIPHPRTSDRCGDAARPAGQLRTRAPVRSWRRRWPPVPGVQSLVIVGERCHHDQPRPVAHPHEAVRHNLQKANVVAPRYRQLRSTPSQQGLSWTIAGFASPVLTALANPRTCPIHFSIHQCAHQDPCRRSPPRNPERHWRLRAGPAWLPVRSPHPPPPER